MYMQQRNKKIYMQLGSPSALQYHWYSTEGHKEYHWSLSFIQVLKDSQELSEWETTEIHSSFLIYSGPSCHHKISQTPWHVPSVALTQATCSQPAVVNVSLFYTIICTSEHNPYISTKAGWIIAFIAICSVLVVLSLYCTVFSFVAPHPTKLNNPPRSSFWAKQSIKGAAKPEFR